MFKAKIKIEFWKQVVGALGFMLEDFKVDATASGISIKAVDKGHVAMAHLQIEKKAFASFKADKCEFGLSLPKVKEMISMGDKDEHFRFELTKKGVDSWVGSRVAAQRGRDRVPEFGGMSGGQAHRWRAGLDETLGHGEAHCRMGVGNIVVLTVEGPDGRQGLRSGASAGHKRGIRAGQLDSAGRGKSIHEGAEARAVSLHSVVEIALEVAGNLDVH